MEKERAIEILESQKSEVSELKSKNRFGSEFKKWKRDTEVAIENIFGEQTRHVEDFRSITYASRVLFEDSPERRKQKAYNSGLDEAAVCIQSMIDEIKTYWVDDSSDGSGNSPLLQIERICNKFHHVARQLRSRHQDRDTLDVDDEYDVQDLFHALLRIYFDDVRAEEYTPSYAGSNSRVDFLLKQHGLAIELKKTRKGLDADELGEQLIIDIDRYQEHPDCDTLICFVYDPDGRIVNPRGVESDLSRSREGVNIIVHIKPRFT